MILVAAPGRPGRKTAHLKGKADDEENGQPGSDDEEEDKDEENGQPRSDDEEGDKSQGA